MITQQEFCLNILEGLATPGGQSTLKTNSSIDPLRPFVTIDIIEGKEFDYSGKISIKVNGLKLNSGNSVFGSNCFDYNCFTGSGLWTTAIVTSQSILIDGVTHYWVSGDKDEEGNIYNVDVGYVYKVTGTQFIVESNIPVINNTVITSSKSIDVGIKFIKLKKITPYSIQDILYTYGDFKQIPLLRSTNKSLLNYNSVDQECDIEDIAITVIQLLTSNYYKKRENQYLYRTAKYVEPSILFIIENNLSRLATLINKDINSLRYGSISRYIATYTESTDIYGIEADNNYIDKTLTCFEDNCFTNNCFELVENNLLVSRYVSTRAMAWVLYAYCTYNIVFGNNKYNQEIEDITTYLINQQDKTGFLTDGWLHNDIYDKAERVTTKSTSTNIIACLSLLKSYDSNNNTTSIDLSTDLYESIINKLYYYNQGIFVTAYDNETPTIESMTYGLLLSSVFNRPDIVNKLNESIAYRFRNGQGGNNLDYVTLTNNDLLTDAQLEIYLANFSQDKTLVLASDSSFIYPFSITEAFNTNVSDTLKYNVFLYNIIDSINKKAFHISFINQITNAKNKLSELQTKDDFINSSVLLADCIVNNNFIFDNDFVAIESIDNVKSLLFYRNFIYDKVKGIWPRDYTWPSEAGLSLKGNLGKILYSVSRTLGNWYIDFNNLIKSRNIKSSTFNNLETWGNDYNLNKRYRETKQEYRKRLTNVISKEANTKIAIEENLRDLEVEVEVKDTWKDIAITTNYTATTGNSLWGEGTLSGPNYAKTNIIKVISKQPIGVEAYKELRNSMASGIKLLVTEKLSYNVKGNVSLGPTDVIPETPNNITFRLTTSEVDFGCLLFSNDIDAVILENDDYIILDNTQCNELPETCNFLLETGNSILLETGSDLLPENCGEDVIEPPLPIFQGGQCLTNYIVVTEITATWRRRAEPQEILSVRTIQFTNIAAGKINNVFFTPNTFRPIPDGYSFYGYENVFLSTTNGSVSGGASNEGINSTNNIGTTINISGSFASTGGVRCDARTDNARIVSVTRVDGLADNCGDPSFI